MKKIMMTGLLMTTLVACNGGGTSSGGGTGGGGVIIDPGLTHSELAQFFVDDFNFDSDVDITLVKDNTLQANFIVIYDPFYDSYDAIDLTGFDPDVDYAIDFYDDFQDYNYFDLDDFYDDFLGEYVYVDPVTGLEFEKVAGTSKDLAKVVAVKEALQIKKSAEFLSSEFGLSQQRGLEIAELKAHWNKASIKSMTAAEVDAFSTELLGFSLTDGISAVKAKAEGDDSSLENLVQRSADLNGVTPEHANQIMTKVFGL